MRILIVEDNPDMREVYELSMERVRAKVFVTEFLEAGLAALPVDCAVIDYSLRHMNGVQVLNGLRQAQPGLPVVFATASTNQRQLNEICATGGVLLRKPFVLSDLHEAIERAVGK